MKHKFLLLISIFSILIATVSVNSALYNDYYRPTQIFSIAGFNNSLAFDTANPAIRIANEYRAVYVRNDSCIKSGYYQFCFFGFRYMNLIPDRTEAKVVISKLDCVEYKKGNTTACKLEIGKTCTNNSDCITDSCYMGKCHYLESVCGDGYCDIDDCKIDCEINISSDNETNDIEIESTLSVSTTLVTTTVASVTTSTISKESPNQIATSSTTTTIINLLSDEKETNFLESEKKPFLEKIDNPKLQKLLTLHLYLIIGFFCILVILGIFFAKNKKTTVLSSKSKDNDEGNELDKMAQSLGENVDDSNLDAEKIQQEIDRMNKFKENILDDQNSDVRESNDEIINNK